MHSTLSFAVLCAATASAWQIPAHGFAGHSLAAAGKPAVARKMSLRGGGPVMGVEVTTTKAGDGKNYPSKGDKLTMHYRGTLTNGKQFDASYDRGQPFQFQIGVGQVIKGWDEGVIKMSLGEAATIKCSSDYAYGDAGMPPVIPAKSELIFEVELLAINGLKA
eukprot:CAMPEP_0173093808 /NCGR_PEP_ID=MMETSP1102-20130122/30395_1 /TAXON_ID=49646 /ORGANISM="Geminigera sp., Strain Caron Lab Isolate" /LENGTH=162 /DNA_ID=CAMNT_0013982263 /DNA_START=6 /DNA_END=494 /DNA_ORIENTATION=-